MMTIMMIIMMIITMVITPRVAYDIIIFSVADHPSDCSAKV